MYAILNDRGHQYKVREGDLLQVDQLSAKKGDAITFDQVLLVGSEGGQVKVGTPTVAGAKVTGVVEDHIKGEKLIAHHRVMTNSLGRRRGHRTKYSVIRIQKIAG
ncbi:MAG TPA: 50S ribosomal protein L21 [Planctomycetota bacterium]|nr:50S ribosomal protein L21 [Planctomycetota bacterium]